jgi:hypothetical protein
MASTARQMAGPKPPPVKVHYPIAINFDSAPEALAGGRAWTNVAARWPANNPFTAPRQLVICCMTSAHAASASSARSIASTWPLMRRTLFRSFALPFSV